MSQVSIVGSDFAHFTGTFANHLPSDTPRGGDLMIAYPPTASGGAYTLRNLTREAGFGMSGGQPTTSSCDEDPDSNLVAVREPSVSWDASEALVSMVVGCRGDARWQVYRVTNIAQDKSGQAQFIKVAGQPPNHNNVSPIYSSHATPRILFTSDMPRGGPDARFSHLKCLDEYELHPSICGLWQLDPANGNTLSLLHHTPSGMFGPTISSSGQIVFTQWDHLDDDQQENGSPAQRAGLINYADEEANAASARFLASDHLVDSVFPEHRFLEQVEAGFSNHVMKVFLPWQINQDGTGTETLNHIGRHEFFQDAAPSRTDSTLHLESLVGAEGPGEALVKAGGQRMEATRFLREDPLNPGTFYFVVSREFGSHGGGCIARMLGRPGLQPSLMAMSFLTDPKKTCDAGGTALYRSPLPSSDGSLWATLSTETATSQSGDTTRYDYHLHRLTKTGSFYSPAAGGALTAGLTRVIDGQTQKLWEFDAVEVVPRSKPAPSTMDAVVPGSPEDLAFKAAGVTLEELTSFMKDRKLALIVSHNVTQRHAADRQQPFNLRVRGSEVASVAPGLPGNVKVLDVSHLQLFSALQLRGQDFTFVGDAAGNANFRRVLAQPWKSPTVNGKPLNPATPGMPAGSIKVSQADGSVAAFVPADRAMTWQLIDSGNLGVPKDRTDGIVRERMWIDFRAGEVRVCVACHGGTSEDQTQTGKKLKDLNNTPAALTELLKYYRDNLK